MLEEERQSYFKDATGACVARALKKCAGRPPLPSTAPHQPLSKILYLGMRAVLPVLKMLNNFMRTWLALVSLSLILASCCGYVKCEGSNYYGQFRIVSATDGRDLVFGPAKVYDKDRIRFYCLNGTDTTYLDYQPLYSPNTGYDSILYVRFLPDNNTAFMRLSNGDVDTLATTLQTYAGGVCCPDMTVIKNFKFNNSADLPGDAGTQAIKK